MGRGYFEGVVRRADDTFFILGYYIDPFRFSCHRLTNKKSRGITSPKTHNASRSVNYSLQWQLVALYPSTHRANRVELPQVDGAV